MTQIFKFLHNLLILPFIVFLTFCLNACGDKNFEYKSQNDRTFNTSFETVEEFDEFYIVSKGDYDSDHDLTNENVKDGLLAHKAWILKARAENNDGNTYLPHRAYPTIQLYKTAQGSFATPILTTFWAYLDIQLEDKPTGQIDDWFSFATFSTDDSDHWRRTVVVNVTPDGYLRLVHVPDQGKQEYIYQASIENDLENQLLFPYRQWVKIDVYLEFHEEGGYAKVWQNNQLVSHAHVNTTSNAIEQTHFGLYAAASIEQGEVYNDQLSIIEVQNEAHALEIMNISQ